MKRFSSVFLLFLGLAFCSMAHADTFSVTVSGELNGTGTFTATDQGGGAYLVTNITGPNVSGPLAINAFDNNDNMLFPDSTNLLDSSGIALIYEQSGTFFNVNFYESGGVYYGYFTGGGMVAADPVNITVTRDVMPTAVTPEPATLLLMLTGLLGIGLITRRRFLPAYAEVAS